MVFETSAAVAISMKEPGFETLEQVLERDAPVVMSAVSYMEASIVLLSLRGPEAMLTFDGLLADNNIDVVAVDVQQARLAREAHARFGKGRGHRAQLNLADCFSYALAKQRNEPLLFVGNDFIHTDVLRA